MDASGRAAIVRDLRQLSEWTRVSGFGRNGKVFFPSKATGERQPVTLEGDVATEDVAGLLYYIADMLEE